MLEELRKTRMGAESNEAWVTMPPSERALEMTALLRIPRLLLMVFFYFENGEPLHL